MKDWTERKGTIANELTKHKDEIYALCNSPNQLNELHDKVMSILDSDALKDNLKVDEAKKVLESCKKKGFNAYTSTLMTFLTGMKVS